MQLKSLKIQKLARRVFTMENVEWKTRYGPQKVMGVIDANKAVITPAGVAVLMQPGTPLFEATTTDDEFHLKLVGFVKKVMKLQAYGKIEDDTLSITIGFGKLPVLVLFFSFVIKSILFLVNPFEWPEFVVFLIALLPLITLFTCLSFLKKFKKYLKKLFAAY